VPDKPRLFTQIEVEHLAEEAAKKAVRARMPLLAKLYTGFFAVAFGLSVVHCVIPAAILAAAGLCIAWRYELRATHRVAMRPLKQLDITKDTIKPVLTRRIPIRVVTGHQTRIKV
jgi:hypothetical protein